MPENDESDDYMGAALEDHMRRERERNAWLAQAFAEGLRLKSEDEARKEQA